MILTDILVNLLIAVGTLSVLWVIYLKIRNAAIVDLGWAIGLTLMGLTQTMLRDTLSLGNFLIIFLVLLWGGRLGGYLFWTRIRIGRKDPRYESLSAQSKLPATVFFFIHFMIQACFQTAVGFVFIFAAAIESIQNLLSLSGFLLWGIGYAGSIVSDAQLHRFLKNPQNRGGLCQRGLWNYSRHPNYFFEILLWTGFAVMGFGSHLGWLGLVSPITLMLTMKFITGPISERQSLKSKPETYRHYQKTTSMIIPWFKRSKQASTISGS